MGKKICSTRAYSTKVTLSVKKRGMGIDLSVKNFISMIQENFRTFIPKDNEIRICLAIIKHLIKKPYLKH